MGFEFAPHNELEICGKKYPLDATDTNFINGVVTEFPRIFAQYDVLSAMQKDLLQNRQKELTEDGLKEVSQKMLEENRKLAEYARNFIVETLGQEAYDEIFTKRAPNTAEHIELCAYIYSEVIQQRDQIVSRYLNPPGKAGKHARTAVVTKSKRSTGQN